MAKAPQIETPRWVDVKYPRSEFLAGLVKGPDVLDVGCAGHVVRPDSPNWLHGTLARNFRVTGIDISEDNVRFMRDLGFKDTHVGSAEDFNFERKFDTIVAGELIEHLSNPGRFLQCAAAHLKDEGQILLSTPFVFSLVHLAYAVGHLPKTCENAQHTLWLCPSTLNELASRYNLQVRKSYLVYEYDPSVESRSYRLYWWALRTVGILIPETLRRNTLVVQIQKFQ